MFYGWDFLKEDRKTRALGSDFAEDIYLKLVEIQATTHFIDSACDVQKDYGMMRSGHCFFDTECLNQKVSEIYIKIKCQWQQDQAKGGATLHRDMVQTYA